ncbi:methyltransferase domain-containing protein [Roseivirga sp. E12]|uniref:methyltransferase domain-containing protein n=1 Tax=Roseivirga sp. E12 TaxID=2819237 RepID=UPI001ABC9557|nr:methyltransferase domain-containing protein [Roseivirga sp. E12]MBO3698734.1 methyltransferase domain-containing protein [Roseivirga sp. E12]
MFEKRAYEEELMDDLDSGGEIIDQTLRELETINRLLGGNQVTIKGLQQLLRKHSGSEPIVIADLGCGGGDIMILVAKWARRKGYKVELKGYDANPNIVAYAQKNCAEYPETSFYTEDIFSEDFKKNRFDIVICTLFTHHFKDDQLISIFHQFKTQAKIGVVINDLHRHWFAYHSIKLLTQLFSKSPMVKYDAPLSVRRAFRRDELLKIMKSAEIKAFSLRWMWAFRWQLIF